jgi:hypothetical protein
MSYSSCSNASWWKSFNATGWSKCGKDNLFITGFYRNHPYSDSDPISLLEEARCCTSIPAEFSEQNSNCTTASWWTSLNSYVLNVSFTGASLKFCQLNLTIGGRELEYGNLYRMGSACMGIYNPGQKCWCT